MKNIKAILFDIDDTIYSHKLKRIPELTKYTIKKLKENGYILGLCSSRFPREFYSLPQDLFDDFDLVIADTGGIILKDNNIIHVETMKQEDIEQSIQYLDQQKDMFYLWVPVEGEPHFSSEPSEHLRQHNINWSGYCPTVQKYNHESLTNILFFNANEKQMNEIIEMVGRESVENWTTSGHINPKGVNKAYGLQYFCNHFNLSCDEVVCFGDGRNDITMIENAGIGIAVGNGHEKLKKHADYVCDTIENGGIYHICVELGLIQPIESKVFFFDIDGTTYQHDIHASPKSTILALKQLKQNGFKICVCTSRNKEEMINLPQDFLNLFDGIVHLAGGYIHLKDQDYKFEVDSNDIKHAVEYLNQHKIPYRYVTKDLHGYLYNSTEFVRGLFDKQYNMIPPEKNYENEPVIHFQYYPFDNKQNEDLINIIKNSKITHLRFSHEVTQNNLDKATAIQFVAKHYGYSRENTVAFGDGFNDVTMLLSAQIGIAMGNACDKAKEASDYVTDSIEQDGLYHACKHFGWI